MFNELAIVSTIFQEKATNRELPEDLPSVIYPSFWAITADTITDNNTYYPAKELQGALESSTGIYSWVAPYEKPFIKNHDEYSSPVYGRVVCARMQKDKGLKYLNLIPRVTDKDAIRDILSGTMYTLSVGVNVEDAQCSICGQMQRSDGYCDHYRGETYSVKGSNGKVELKLCYYSMVGVTGREISSVNIPSDKFAHISNPDLGIDVVNKITGSGNVASATESFDLNTPTNKSRPSNYFISFSNTPEKGLVSFTEAFGGQISDSFAKEKGIVTMPNKPSDSTEKKELEFDVIELPELTSVENIVKATGLLYEAKESGKKLDPTVVLSISSAYAKSGLSDEHYGRLEFSSTEGKSILPKDKVSESLKSALEISEGQIPFTVESLFEKIETLFAETVTLKDTIASTEVKVTEMETTLSESADVAKYTEAQTQIKALTENLKSEQEASHSILLGVVTSEMIRQGHKLALTRSSTELQDHLNKRSRESLLDTYTDLMENEVKVVAPKTSNPILEKTGKSVTQQLAELLSVSSVQDPSSIDDKVTEDKEDTYLISQDDKGNIVVELKESDDAGSSFSLEGLDS